MTCSLCVLACAVGQLRQVARYDAQACAESSDDASNVAGKFSKLTVPNVLAIMFVCPVPQVTIVPMS